MIYAIIADNVIVSHGSASVLWPDTSFSSLGPNASFLAEVGAVAIRSDAPYDPATEISQSCAPYLLDGDVFNTIATPIPAPPPPAPDWARFKRISLGSDSLNAILADAYQSAPVAAGALAPALLRCESGDANDFAASWAAIGRAVAVPPEVVATFVAVASDCHLPADFVAALQPREN
jgi:hypothetical protein